MQFSKFRLGIGAPYAQWPLYVACIGAIALLGGCAGGIGTELVRGTLTPAAVTKTASLSTANLTTALNAFEEGKWILSNAGALTCGVDVYHYEYNTVDGRGQPTTASSALMVPTGDAPQCKGPRPIVIGMHGTVTDKAYNLADLSGKNSASPRAVAFAATYASQGYVVVAPNYAGYDTSSLSYHPYLNAEQQSKDVIDSLISARKVLPSVSTTSSDKLFLVGYSQGGYVTMATHRAMQEVGMPVTASMPSSGAYGLAAAFDDVFMGHPLQGATVYFPMAVESFQAAYGTVYTSPGDLYDAKYAAGIPGLLPSKIPFPTLIAQRKLPVAALFNSTPPTTSNADLQSMLAGMTPATTPASLASTYAAGFGAPGLVDNTARLAYIEDVLAHPDGAVPNYTTGLPPTQSQNRLRQAVIKNDLRGWIPRSPVVMCGGTYDPATPFRFGAQLMMEYWSNPASAAPAGMASVLNFEDAPSAGDPYAQLRTNFVEMKAKLLASGGESALTNAYHAGLLPRYCYTAARQLFDSLR